MTEREKYLQIRREALWTGLALLILIVFWYLAGFGLANCPTRLFGLPLWAVGGSIGVWFFAMALVKLLTTFIFKDFDLETEEEAES